MLNLQAIKLSCSFFILLVACGGCTQRSVTLPAAGTSSLSEVRDGRATQVRQQLKAITIADGISKAEAELIAECYFYRNVGCGGFTGIRDGGEYWIVDGAFGYAAIPIQGFHIYKGTGKIISPIGPSYATPFEIFP